MNMASTIHISDVIVGILEGSAVCLLRGCRVPWFDLYLWCAAAVAFHIIVACIHTADDTIIRMIHFLCFHWQSSLVIFDFGIIIYGVVSFIACRAVLKKPMYAMCRQQKRPFCIIRSVFRLCKQMRTKAAILSTFFEGMDIFAGKVLHHHTKYYFNWKFDQIIFWYFQLC